MLEVPYNGSSILSCALHRIETIKNRVLGEYSTGVIEDEILEECGKPLSVFSFGIAKPVVSRGFELSVYSDNDWCRELQGKDNEKIVEAMKGMLYSDDVNWFVKLGLENYMKAIGATGNGNGKLSLKYVPDLKDVVVSEKDKNPIINLDMQILDPSSDLGKHFEEYRKTNPLMLSHCVLVVGLHPEKIEVFEPYKGEIQSFDRDAVLRALKNEVLILEP